MKFKVCGLFNDKNIQQVAELNPDYIGHIFWEKSVRYVKTITPNLKSEIKKLVFFLTQILHDSKYLVLIAIQIFVMYL